MDEWGMLIDAIKRKYRKALITEIKPIIFDILRKHIYTDIYYVYAPTENGWVEYDRSLGRWKSHVTYQRRYGLLDPTKEYFRIADESSGNIIRYTLFATIDEEVSPFPRKKPFAYRKHGAFLELLETGRLGIFTNRKFGGSPFPRPAVSNAQAEVDKSSRIKAINRRLFGSR